MSTFIRIPIGQIVEPPNDEGDYRLLRNRYWLCDHEENALFLGSYNAPACNTNRTLAEWFAPPADEQPSEVVFIEKAWVPLIEPAPTVTHINEALLP